MCNNLPVVSEEMKKAVNATYGSQERTRGEIRALAETIKPATPKSGTQPS